MCRVSRSHLLCSRFDLLVRADEQERGGPQQSNTSEDRIYYRICFPTYKNKCNERNTPHITASLRIQCTVEPLLKNSPNKGHHRNYLPTKDTFLDPKNRFSYSANTFSTYKEWTTSLQWTNYLVPICPL